MDQNIFSRRRSEFMQKMEGGIAVFCSAPTRNRNSDVDFEFRQDSDFYYLTGFEEPESYCVLAPGNQKHEYLLFVLPRDREKETWTGIRAGVEGAIQTFGAEMAYTNDRLEDVLTELLQNACALHYSLNRYPEADRKIFAVLDHVRAKGRAGIYPPSKIIDPSETLAEMRLHKKADELDALQQAVNISVRAHSVAMKATAAGRFEYEIQALLEYVFRSGGSQRNGYPSIVGSGPNTCILHYTQNSRKLQDGDLLLIDAGAEFDYYTADITRTYPVNGRFTPEQREIYELVLDAQKKAIAAMKPGTTWMQVHSITVRNLTQGMLSLGLLHGTLEENLENEHYKKYYMHRTGHWLGLDVHDAGKYKQTDTWRVLEPGMVMTVEPGLYVPPDDESSRFRGIGIRIEDDVLITENGPKVLSENCPKEIDDLEAMVGTSSLPLFS